MDLPLIRPNPPRLSAMLSALETLEASGTYSNNGPVVRRLESEMTARLFGGRGACLAVANATLGLMLALKHATRGQGAGRTLALMPAFTFAATAQAALWAGLTPLLGDCDPDDWALCARDEERLLAEHGRRIGAIVPYATFGNAIDLDRYAWLARRHDLAVVVDAAASLGSLDGEGRGFGTDAPFPVVYSMHATKTFATSEGGIIHCADAATIETLRAMANFGFVEPRSASLPGLNAKLAEVPALIALEKLREIDDVAAHREMLAERYRQRLAAFSLQRPHGHRQAMQFFAVLLPTALARHRGAIVARLAEAGIGSGTYFSPHIAEQPYFREACAFGALPVTDDIAARMLALPVTDAMSIADVDLVANALIAACSAQPRLAVTTERRAMPRDQVLGVVVVGGGPAGTALLCAAGKAGRLDALAAAGIALIDRGTRIGTGRLGDYAITSDSTAETFLTADGALPAGLSLGGDPAAAAIREHKGGLGVPLPKVGAYLDRLGEALGQRLVALGGSVVTGHEVVAAQQTADGLWTVRARRIADGSTSEVRARSLVLATGGCQPATRLVEERVAGRSLVERCGGRLIQSDMLLADGGIEAIATQLPEGRPARIAIVGGSTSAVTAAVRLLKAPGVRIGAGGLALIHRRPLRPFYPSAEAARADGFDDFGLDDICPVSGFVYRLAGFRLEARELVIHALGIGGRVGDPRLRLHRLAGDEDGEAARLLDEADLVIAAFGYRPHALPLVDAAGRSIRLRAEGPLHGPMVDAECRVIDAAGAAVPGVFGLGLAAGFVPSGDLGGEKSFRGQANGLWLWQNDVGRLIVDRLLARADEAANGLRATA